MTTGENFEDRPVLANLTQADLDRIRAEYKVKQEQQASEQTGEVSEQTSAKTKVN